MSHIGVFCLPVPGHLHPMAALGRALIGRGHRVTYFGVPDAERAARAEGLAFHPIGAADFPPGALAALLAELGTQRGLAAIRTTTEAIRRGTIVICRDGPAALRAVGIEALLVDGAEPGASSLAEYLGLPFVTVFNALALNEERDVPPITAHWGPARGPLGRLRNGGAYALHYALAGQVGGVLWSFRRAWRLPMLRGINQSFSPLAQICQMPAAFDFPRRRLPAHFHYTGPLRLASSRPIPFPYERLSGRPLIYASLGTLQNRRPALFHTIAAACAGLDTQLVLSLGGADPAHLPPLPGDPLVVRYAPQPELVARAALTITHGGMNTVLESLAVGTPLVAIPITNDQPGVAARLQRSGAGEVVRLGRLDARTLRAAVERVLGEPAFRAEAQRMREAMRAAGGAARAAEIVAAALATRRPVLAEW